MCRLQFYRNIQKKSTNPSIRTLVSTLQFRFLCVFRILPYTHSTKRPSRLSSHPGRGIGAAQLSAKRRLIRQAGPGQYPCHQPVERGGMIGMDPMAKLMDHHIRRAVRRGQDKSGVQRQPVPPGRAAPPSRAHPSQSQGRGPIRPSGLRLHP